MYRLASMKKAADIAGRKICFIGMSLTSYLEAADANGRAPFNPQGPGAPVRDRHHRPQQAPHRHHRLAGAQPSFQTCYITTSVPNALPSCPTQIVLKWKLNTLSLRSHFVFT